LVELGSSEAYMPNCADLQLVNKSSYSATKNPVVHNWVHILGTLLSGIDRSKKTAIVGSPTPVLMLAAATAAYRMGKSSRPSREEPRRTGQA
jgi:hypothetical protein